MSSTSDPGPSAEPSMAIPESVLNHCLRPYIYSKPPSAHGLRIIVPNSPYQDDGEDAIVLPAPLADRVQASLERGFSGPQPAGKLSAYALCAPVINDSLSVDAAVMYSAYICKADVVVLDAEDFFDGERGVLGPELCSALWGVYEIVRDTYHEQCNIPSPGSHEELLAVLVQLARQARSARNPPVYATDAYKAVFARAVAALRALVNARVPLSHSTRRRLLYLRNFGAMCNVLDPLLEALRVAIDSCDMPVLVVTGIWRVPLLQCSATGDACTIDVQRHTTFVEGFRGQGTLRKHIEAEFSPAGHAFRSSNDRFSDISDVFLTGIMQQHGARRLKRRLLGTAAAHTFEFARVLSVSAERRGPMLQNPGRCPTAVYVTRWNIQHLWLALGELDVVIPTDPPISSADWIAQAETPQGSITVRRLSTEILSHDDLEELATAIRDSLPPSPSHSDLLRSILQLDAATAVLDSHIKARHPECAGTDGIVDAAMKRLSEDAILDAAAIEHLRALVVDAATITTRYDDVYVQQEIIDELHSGIVLPLKRGGASLQAGDGLEGYLLYGPPGTGKTMLCRALARESGVRLIQIRPSDVQSHLAGVSEKLIRCIFALARLVRPCIIVVDEPDALFGRRGGGGNSERWLRSMLVEFMQEMDGLTAGTNNANIVLIGATNRPHDIDDAVLRRLPHRILVDLPGRPQREGIIRSTLKGKQTDESIDVLRLAERTAHYSGSDLKHLVRFAAQVALKDALQAATSADSRNPTDPASPEALSPTVGVISARHFDLALRKIKASCLTNMAALRRVQYFERAEPKSRKRSLAKYLRRLRIRLGRGA